MPAATVAAWPPVPRSAKDRPSYRCTECGWTTAKWLGRCPECQAWGTVEEYGAPAVRTTAAGRVTTAALPIGQVDGRQATARTTGVPELDRVLGGGLVPGAVVLLAGEPGVGKSTLLLDVAAKAASEEHRTLYVTGEESASQVRLRADRIGAIDDHLYLAAETDLSAVLGHLDAVKPSLLILDSVQTVASPEIDGAPGGMAQVREVAGALIRASKERGMSTLLVGHVTKDGAIAGPRLLEHLVDVVLSFEGDRHARLRLVRGVKNRYGATDEVGCFELHDEGITGLADPCGLFLTRRAEPVPGTCLTVTLEGTPSAGRRGAGADRGLPDPLAPAHHLGPGDLPCLDDAGGAGAARPDQRARQAGHLQRDGGRGEAAPSPPPTWPSRWRWPARPATPRCRRTWSPSARWVSPARSDASPASSAGSRRRHRLGFTHALVPGDPGKVPAGMKVDGGRRHGRRAAGAAPLAVGREAPREDGGPPVDFAPVSPVRTKRVP